MISLYPFWAPHPMTWETVMPFTSIWFRAAFTSSNISSLTIASTLISIMFPPVLICS